MIVHEMPDLKFGLHDDVSIGDLRQVDEWQQRLSDRGKLRVQRRGEVLGVLLSPKAWAALEKQTMLFEQVLGQIEDERDLRLIEAREREGGEFLSGDALASAVERELEEAGLLP
jgi:hypothetical protein